MRYAVTSASNYLAWLFDPISPQEFSDQYWAIRPARVSRESPGYYADVFSLEHMEQALASGIRFSGAAEILAEGQPPLRCRSEAEIQVALKQGKSIRVTGVQRFVSGIGKLCAHLEQASSAHVNVNMYLSPGEGKRALRRHFDTHDVIALQVQGSKRWRLYDSPVDAPLEFLPLQRRERMKDMRRHRLGTDQSGRDACNLTEEFVLRQGDLLYLPRGFWHEAVTDPGELSCHLTVGIQTVTYLEAISVAMAVLSGREAKLRQSLPFGFTSKRTAFEAAAREMEQVLSGLVETFDARAGMSEIAAAFLRSQASAISGEGLLHPQENSHVEIDRDTKVEISPAAFGGMNFGVSPVRMTVGGMVFEVPLQLEDSCSFLMEMRSARAAELPGSAHDDEKVGLLQQLQREGVVRNLDSDGIGSGERAERWSPISVNLNSNKVKWVATEQLSLNEPFFHQSITKLKATPHAKVCTTRLSALARLDSEQDPDGLIFHMSRCGSTTVANALRASGATVLSEAQPINALLTALSGADTLSEAFEKWKAKLRKAVSSYRWVKDHSEGRFVIKFSSWNILHLALIRQVWPEVPSIIVVRSPLEVAVSCLEGAPGWMHWKEERKGFVSGILSVSETALESMTQEEYCARMLNRFLHHALLGVDDRTKILSHDQISLSVIHQIAGGFGIHDTSLREAAIRTALRLYSKDADLARNYEPDSLRKVEQASKELNAQVTTQCDPLFARLHEKALSDFPEVVKSYSQKG
jgi:ribosomal protein L16 Arg81 hydroxylase